MLAPSVQILPNSSIDRLVLLSSRTIIGDSVCAGFARTGAQAGDQQIRFVSIPRMAQRRQRRLSSLDFESAPVERTRSFQCSARAAFGHVTLVRWAPLPQIPQDTQPQMEGVSPLECALTKKGEGVPVYFTLQSTSFFVSLEPKCHNGLLWGRGSIYRQSFR
jgi:hypothetical protein